MKHIREAKPLGGEGCGDPPSEFLALKIWTHAESEAPEWVADSGSDKVQQNDPFL